MGTILNKTRKNMFGIKRLATTSVRSASRIRNTTRFAPAVQQLRQFATDDTQISSNLTTPHESVVLDKKIELVTVPGAAGYFGIAPDHVPTVQELLPGLVSVTNKDQSITNYFVSGGFVFVHENSTVDLSVLECFPLEQLDPQRVRNNIDSFTKQMASAQDEAAKVKAQIGLEVSEAAQYALENAK